MKKVKLDLDALSVESFATAGGAKQLGTVRGAAYTEGDASCQESCNAPDSCWGSCIANGCYDTMNTCPSEYNTYDESCMANACPNSFDVACGGGGGTRPPYKPLTGL